MQCFELTDHGVTIGLRVEAHPTPHVTLSSDVEKADYFNLDHRLSPLIQKTKSLCPDGLLRIRNLTIVRTPNEEDYMTTCPPDRTALVYLRVSAARPRGVVVLQASNNRGEFCRGDEIVPWFAPFPSLGISLLSNPYGKDMPWMDGLPSIELALVMMKGASFRIFRTEAPRGVQRATFVKWTGSSLEATKPMGRGMENEVHA